MCGVGGVVLPDLPEEAGIRILSGILSAISHRGERSFQNEIFRNDWCAVGANRLAFTSGTTPQPEASSDGRYRVFLSGELYSLFGSKGPDRTAISDTRAFAERLARADIETCLAEQEGMFALVVIDTLTRDVYLARDRFGIKPLYYAFSGPAVVFGSEMKAIASCGHVSSIAHVEPGELVRIRIDAERRLKIEKRRFSRDDANAECIDSNDLGRDVFEALVESVAATVADNQHYALFLSGGLDSSSIYLAAKLAGARVTAFVLTRGGSVDMTAAMKVTRHFGDPLIVVQCPPERELFEEIPETIRICESFEPNVVRQSAANVILARAVAKAGFRVALCGEGADELFGGYPEFWNGRLPFEETRRRFLADLHRTQLQRVDRTSMASTIEVRVPFLSRRMARAALSSNTASVFGSARKEFRDAKLPLRLAVRDKLPEEIVWRGKMVLSEGVGLRGNSPQDGMFSDLVDGSGHCREKLEPDTSEKWHIGTAEEAYYFKIFESYGYAKYSPAQHRVFANATTTGGETQPDHVT